jgi:hypothetical protein
VLLLLGLVPLVLLELLVLLFGVAGAGGVDRVLIRQHQLQLRVQHPSDAQLPEQSILLLHQRPNHRTEAAPVLRYGTKLRMQRSG